MAANIKSPATKLANTAVLTVLSFYFIVVFMINVFPFLDGNQDLLDFGSFYASGVNLRNGENPYTPDSEYVLHINFPRVEAGGDMINLNPPISAMVFGAIAKVDPWQALIVWQGISAGLFLCLIFVLAAEYQQNFTPAKFIWAFTLTGFWQTLTLGQIYVFLLVFVILGWILVQRKRYILAGLAIGVVIAIKPNFIIWPLFLFVSGYSIVFVVSVLTSLLISLLPALLYGVQIYQQWLEASALGLGTLRLPGNSSLVGLTSRFNAISLGIGVSLILLCTLLYGVKKKSPVAVEQLESISALGIIVSILASPISWVGYTLFLLPVFFSMKKWTFATLLSAAILCFPFAFVLKLWQTSFFNFVIFGWFYGWGILSLLAAVVKNTMMTKSIQTN